MVTAERPKLVRSSSSRHRSTLSVHRTSIVIHVYDLLPPGKVSNVLWTLGSSLLHSGVVIRDREYAYGGHSKRNLSGVYWTRPRQEPPGGTFRCEIFHGITFRREQDIEKIIQEVAEKFQGTSYNLLTKNCNHFTSYLCKRLTGKPAPSWLNRAATIGLALPCVIPREWIAPPDHDTADGELLEDDSDDDESTAMLRTTERESADHRTQARQSADFSGQSTLEGENLPHRSDLVRVVAVKDTSGRTLPVPERAPVPRTLKR